MRRPVLRARRSASLQTALRGSGRSALALPQRPPEGLCDALRGLVLSARYAPGERISAARAAADLGADERDALAALRALEMEGLLVLRPGEGAVVSPTDPERFEEGMRVLASLEAYATAIAAPHLRREDLSLLLARTDEMAAAIEQGDALRFGVRNRAFHQLLCARCPNGALVDALRAVNRALDSVRVTVFVSLRDRAPHSVQEHLELVELLQAGAPRDRIEALAREHKLRTVREFRAWRAGERPEAAAWARAPA
ncbi:MAG TPA: GntR family transcriptional regulator [Solirubrobacteraceae bacterium]|nr:GntR family transcriptional regulator [Solirubrobacteraceae bacterium]